MCDCCNCAQIKERELEATLKFEREAEDIAYPQRIYNGNGQLIMKVDAFGRFHKVPTYQEYRYTTYGLFGG
jgi:hypothetical protein